MKTSDLKKYQTRLKNFLSDLLSLVGRTERRHWGEVYIRGLLSDSERKSVEAMALKMNDGNVQAMQQFIGQSPWDYVPVRKHLVEKMVSIATPPVAWLIDDTGFPKQGKHSVGVARQYSGTLGKVGNCQIAVSLNYATDSYCFPLDFSLYLPEEWINDPTKRSKAGIPQEQEFQKKWEIALKMIDQTLTWKIPQGVIVADAGYGKITAFRKQLERRELKYVVGVDNSTSVWEEAVNSPPPMYQMKGRAGAKHYGLPNPRSVLKVVKSRPRKEWQEVAWRKGSKGVLCSNFLCIRVQPAHGHAYGKVEHKMCWLLAEWPKSEEEPTKFWFSNLPEETTLHQLVYMAKIRWWIEQNYQQLKEELGLDHFEGRSWLGWHHHVTMTMIAFGFLTSEMIRLKKNYWVDYPENQDDDSTISVSLDRSM